MSERKPTATRRIEIADAALDIVASRGIASLSTSALASALGLSTGALFKHFATRDALLVGMCERASELLGATFPPDALPARERLRRFAVARLDLVGERAGILRLVLSEQFALALPPEAALVLRSAVRDTHAFVARTIAEAQRDGSVRSDVPPDGLAMLFMGALQVTAFGHQTGALPSASPIDVLDVLVTPNPKESS